MTPARKIICFDIETAPLPDHELARFMPNFSAPANFKDPEKIQQSLDAQKLEWAAKATLSPLTSRVDAIGYMVDEKITLDIDSGNNESQLLVSFWNIVKSYQNYDLVGFNILKFDLPHLIRRSWKLGATIPPHVRDGRYFDRRFVDLMEIWGCGVYGDMVSLDKLARFMGLEGKLGSGDMFHKMEPEQKRKYLTRDVELVRQLAERMLP